LIRTSTDSGVVVIADPRVVRMAYGRELMRVLPPARRLTGRWEDLRVEIQRFYNPLTAVRSRLSVTEGGERGAESEEWQ
jgi:hypothetical protein